MQEVFNLCLCVAGGLCAGCKPAAHLLLERLGDNGWDRILQDKIVTNICSGVLGIAQDAIDGSNRQLIPTLGAIAALPALVNNELLRGPGGVALMDKAHDLSLGLVDRVALGYNIISERGHSAEAQCFFGVLAHPAFDILRELPGIFLRHGLQDGLEEDAFAAFVNSLGDGQHANAVRAELLFVNGAVVAVPGKTIKLPNKHILKRMFGAIRNEPLELRARFGISAGQRTITILTYHAETALLRVLAAFGKLAVDGLIVLAGG